MPVPISVSAAPNQSNVLVNVASLSFSRKPGSYASTLGTAQSACRKKTAYNIEMNQYEALHCSDRHHDSSVSHHETMNKKKHQET